MTAAATKLVVPERWHADMTFGEFIAGFDQLGAAITACVKATADVADNERDILLKALNAQLGRYWADCCEAEDEDDPAPNPLKYSNGCGYLFGLVREYLRARTNKSPEKKKRGRPKGSCSPENRAIRDHVLELTERFDRMTVRGVFYQAEVAGLAPKTESGYRKVQQQVLAMRREGELAWDFITDGTRWQRKPRSFTDASAYVEQMARVYRRDLWQSQKVRVEIWLEKDALADLVWEVTAAWDVSLMVSRGQSSDTFLYTAAQAAQEAWEGDEFVTSIYTMYDYDKAGDETHRAIERKISGHAKAGTPITVERLAVTKEQVEEWNLPTRPPKKNDPRPWAVELDAIDPKRLADLVEDAIVRHVDQYAWSIEKIVEREECKGLLALAETFGGGE